MKKNVELSMPGSCWNKAREDERVFILLARDPAAPVAIRAWVQERVRLGKNEFCDEQLQEAIRCADLMDEERKQL